MKKADKGVELLKQATENESKKEHDDIFGVEVWSFENEYIINQKVKVTDPSVFSIKKVWNSRFAVFFSLSIVVIYTVLGLIISMLLEAEFINWLSTNWVPNVFFIVIFMIFAASFFGAFEIVLPSWIVNKSDKQADKGGYVGAFFMIFILVLVSFFCTAPIVGTVLVEAARGSVLRPIIGMLGFLIAVALPVDFFVFSPSKLNNLPKSGVWLNTIKWY